MSSLADAIVVGDSSDDEGPKPPPAVPAWARAKAPPPPPKAKAPPPPAWAPVHAEAPVQQRRLRVQRKLLVPRLHGRRGAVFASVTLDVGGRVRIVVTP